MKVLGIQILKNEIRYSLLEGTINSPILVTKEKVPVITAPNIPKLMNWFESNFREKINLYKPNKISYRLTLDPNKDQIINLEFPLGILNLLCHEQKIEINSYTSKSFTATKVGRGKDVDIYELCDEVFDKNPPYWDKYQKNSVIVAWFDLER